MKKFCQVLTVLALVVVGIGFYRGWFSVSGDRASGTGKAEVKLSVDSEKVKHDAGAVADGITRKESGSEH